MKIALTLLSKILPLLIITLSSKTAFTQTVHWAQSYGTSAGEEARTVKTDKDGNSYLGGFTSGSGGAFVRKYNNSGELIWTQTYAGNVVIYGLEIDENNQVVYLTGMFGSAVNFGGINLSSNGSFYEDVFILKMDTAGVVIWAKKFGNNDRDCGRAVTVDGNGDVYLSGFYKKAFNIGNTTLPNYTNETRFLAKLNAAGTVQWAKQIGTRGNATSSSEIYFINNESGNTVGTLAGYGLDCDANNNLYLSGTIAKVSNFDTISINYTKSSKVFFLAKFNSNGAALWVRTNADNYYGAQNTGGLVVDNNNDIISGGYAEGNCVFSSSTITQVSPFVLKYDEAGNLIWLLQGNYINGFSDIFSGCPTGYSVDGNNNPNFIGYFGGSPLSFSGITLDAGSAEKMFIFSLNTDGGGNWGIMYGGKTNGTMYENPYAVCTNQDGAINIVGRYDGTTDYFGSITLNAAGSTDAFNMRINGMITGTIRNPEAIPNIYPNPAKDLLNLSGLKDIESISLYNTFGEKVYANNGNMRQINLHDFPRGIYLLVLQGKYNKTIHKIMVE